MADAFYLIQVGTKLYRMSLAGVATELTLPDGVTIEATREPVFAILGRHILLANSPNRILWYDAEGALRPGAIAPPASPPKLASGGVGALTGAYRVKQTFLVKDRYRRVIYESGFGPPSDVSPTLASNSLAVSGTAISPDTAVNASRFYRTASDGSVYFQWLDIDGNTQTGFTDNITDEGLSTLAAPTDLGLQPGAFPPHQIRHLTEWKERLWLNTTNKIDQVNYSASRKFYGWPASQFFQVPPEGNDLVGVTGFIRRRDELGICREDRIYKIVGNGPTNFNRIQVVDGIGCVAPRSIEVIRDVGYFLGGDGVYQWGPDGVKNVSALQVQPWFTTDDYFNRSRFPFAKGRYNRRFNLYELLLSAAGSTALDRWVAYDLTANTWYGPHTTAAFTPTCAAEIVDSNGLSVPVFGASNGILYKQDPAVFNDDASAVDFDVRLRHTCNTPDLEKVFLQPTVHTRIESAGGTLQVIPALGNEAAVAQAAISRNLLLDRERLRRISTDTNPTGRMLTLRFRINTVGRRAQVRGYEIPYFETGRR
jgi:hypothetical protein